jgi:hypothetical protein
LAVGLSYQFTAWRCDALINGSWFRSALGLAIGLDRLKGKGVGSLDQFERNAGMNRKKETWTRQDTRGIRTFLVRDSRSDTGPPSNASMAAALYLPCARARGDLIHPIEIPTIFRPCGRVPALPKR